MSDAGHDLGAAAKAFRKSVGYKMETLLPHRDAVLELRAKGASLALISRLLENVGIHVSTDTIRRLCLRDPQHSPRITSPRERWSSKRQSTSLQPPAEIRLNPLSSGDRESRIPAHDDTRNIMKRLILIMNGKGGVGKSTFATNLVQHYKDLGVPHRSVDTDNENSTLKRFYNDADFVDLSLPRGSISWLNYYRKQTR